MVARADVGPAGARVTRRLPAIARRVTLGAVVAIAVLIGAAAPAGAHAVLVSTEPATGVSLDSAPEEIVLRYTEPVDLRIASVRVYDSRGDEVGVGDVEHLPGEPATARVTVEGLADGAYAVTWRVTSSDGHPIQGAFTFAVGNLAAAADAEGLAARLLAEEGGSTVLGTVYAIVRLLVFASVLLLVGGLAFLLVIAPTARGSAIARRILLAALVVGVVTALASIGLQGANAAGGGLGDALDNEIWGDALGTRFGRAALLRAVALLAAVPVLRDLRAGLDAPSRAAVAAAAAGGFVALVTFAVAGHASSGRWVAAAVVVDVAHLAAAALWFGGVVLLSVAVLRGVAMLTDGDVAPTLQRFSRLASGAVVALTLTGVFQAWRQLDGLEGLTRTDYGRLLLLKLLFVLAIVTVASSARDVVRKRMHAYRAATASLGPGAMSVDEERARATARNLRQGVALEIAFAVVVLAATALLVNADPVRADRSEPFSGTLQTEDVWFDVEVIDASAGLNDVHVTAREPGLTGVGRDVLEMTATLTETERDIAPIDVPLRRISPGHYQARGVTIPFPGDWTLEVTALISDVEQVSASATLEID